MDNFRIDITSEGDKSLRMAMDLSWPNAPGGKATHWREVKLIEKVEYYQDHIDPTKTSHHFATDVVDPAGVPTLILYWNQDENVTPLPYPLNLEQAFQFASGWLNQVERGRQPDHDGSNGKGWRVFKGAWGRVLGTYSFLAIQPAWAMYGK